MTLISLAIVVAFVTSWAGTLGLFEVEIWWELATLITIMLLGHWLEMRSIAQARGALVGPRGAAARHRRAGDRRRHRDGPDRRARGRRRRPRPARRPGPGRRRGRRGQRRRRRVDDHRRVARRRQGARRRASIAGHRRRRRLLRVRVTADGRRRRRCRGSCGWSPRRRRRRRGPRRSPTAPPRSCSTSRSPPARSRSSCWWLLGDPEGALVRTATVLVIACPHALGLAIPLVIAISTSLGARNGLLVKDRLALERARDARHRDLRQDRHADQGRAGRSPTSRRGSTDAERRPPARGGGRGRLGAPARPGDRRRRAGSGASTIPAASDVRGAGRSRRARHGRRSRRRRRRTAAARRARARAARRSPTDVGPARAGRSSTSSSMARSSGVVAVEDEIRPESKEAVDALHALGVRVAMITGDSQAVADSVARRLGIDEVAAQVLPADKAAAVERFQAGRAQGRDGRRRRERRAGAGDGRRRHRHRRRHRRRRRVGRHRARPERPARRRRRDRAVAGDLPQDGPEPRLGDRLQPRRDPGRRWAPRARGASTCRWRSARSP